MIYDAAIIGAGPAGLTAATYLARFRRSVLVLDGGPSRAHWIPESHNTPGFPHGVGGDTLLQRLRSQAETYGAQIRSAKAEHLEASGSGFDLTAGGARVSARSVLLATGVVDHIPNIEGIAAAIHDSRVRMCPICDAYEAIDRRIAVLADGPLGEREADFLSRFSADISVLQIAPSPSANVEIENLSLPPGRIVLSSIDQMTREFDHLYLALGCHPQNALARDCGASRDEKGALLVDDTR